MRVLVTGGAGFIGSHLVDALVAGGHHVRVVDNLEAQVHGGRQPSYLNRSAEYLFGDVRDRSILEQALDEIEVVFHQAAIVGVGQSMYQIERYLSANVLGTAVLLEAIVHARHRPKKLVVASSMSLYGEGLSRCTTCGAVAPPLRSEDQLNARRWEMVCPQCGREVTPQPTPEDKTLAPSSVYAVSKRDQEELCLTVGRSYGIPTVALRYFNVYGPRQALSNPYTGAAAIFSARIKNGHAPLIFEDGRQSRDFVHVSDVVRANLLVMDDPRADWGTFNVGTGRPTSVLEIAQLLIRLYGAAVQPAITGKFRAGDIRHCYAEITKIRAVGFRPAVALEEGLRDLVAWGKGQAAEDRVEAATQELEARGLTQ